MNKVFWIWAIAYLPLMLLIAYLSSSSGTGGQLVAVVVAGFFYGIFGDVLNGLFEDRKQGTQA